MNLLFVCSRNQWRSPTAEKIFDKSPHHARSAGVSASARIKVSEKLIGWADLIFVMEKRHRDILSQKFGYMIDSQQLIVLDIPDDYQYMDDELVELLTIAVTPYLPQS